MRTILVLGDSHSRYFRHAAMQGLLLPYPAFVCEAQGATAAGLTNPDSFTAAAQQYRQFLADKPKDAHVVIHLGEVDCGILIWLRQAKNQQPLQVEMERSITAYFTFVDELIETGFSGVIVTGATVPTINDTDHVGSIVTERRSKVSATQRQRTDLTREFNAALRREASKRNLPFVDIWESAINPLTGLANEKFRNKDVRDHHMDDDLAALAWSQALREALKAIDPVDMDLVTLRAIHPTFVKALNVSSTSLPDELKLPVARGQEMTMRIAHSDSTTIVLSEVSVDGAELPDSYRFIYKPHWSAVTSA